MSNRKEELKKELKWFEKDSFGESHCPICNSIVMLHCKKDEYSYLMCDDGHKHDWIDNAQEMIEAELKGISEGERIANERWETKMKKVKEIIKRNSGCEYGCIFDEMDKELLGVKE